MSITSLGVDEIATLRTLSATIAEAVGRIHRILGAVDEQAETDFLALLDPGNPANKSGKFLSLRGIEVCYSLFDIGKNRHEVKILMNISFGAADNRFKLWSELGGAGREKNPDVLV